MSREEPFDGEPGDELDPAVRRAFAELDRAIAELPRIEPGPWFEAQFRARLARAEEPRGRRTWRERFLPFDWLIGAAALTALVLVMTLGNPSLPEQDWSLLAQPEDFELLMDSDPELLSVVDVLEAWDGVEEL